MSNAKFLPLCGLLVAALISACSSKGKEPEPAVTVTVSVVGNGTVTSDDGTFSCAPLCTATVASGTTLSFTASAASGSQFFRWGGACAAFASGPACTITVGAAGATVVAEFTQQQALGDTWALIDGNTLITFNRTSPEIVSSVVELTGLAAGETLIGMDFRVADGKLYAIGSQNNLYRLPHTATTPSAAVTRVSALGSAVVLQNVSYGVDADPVNDVLRVIGSDGSNHTVNFETGAVSTDAPLSGRKVSAIAHTHAFSGSTGTVLFGLDLSGDASSDALVLIPGPADGSSRDAGTLRVDGAASAAFDVVGTNLEAYALLNIDNATRLFRINLGNGVATLMGSLNRQGTVNGLAIPPQTPTDTRGDMLAISAGVVASGGTLVPFNQLISFNRAGPGTILSRSTVVGLMPGEKVADADYRPADQQLYVLSDLGNLYVIDETTSLLSLHATLADDGSNTFTGLGSSSLGAAFNPVTGKLQVVTASGQNLIVDPDTGAVSVQARLTYSNGDDASATAIDFSDSFAGVARSQTLVIDTATDNVAKLNGSSLGTKGGGPLVVDAGGINGFDIDPISGVAYAALTVDGATRLYTITQTSTDFGAAVSPAAIGDGQSSVVAVAIKPPLNAKVYGVTTNNELVSFLASDPGTILSQVPITGLGAGAQVAAIDFRASDGVLFAVTSDNRIYTLNRDTAVATLSAEMFDSPNDPSNDFAGIGGSVDGIGAAFDPRAGDGTAAFRVTSEAGENLRVIPASGETFTDSLSYAPVGFPPDLCDNTGSPDASSVAYSNDRVTRTTANATIFITASGADGSTCLYTVDAADGTASFVGATQDSASDLVGMDIAGGQDGLPLGVFDASAASANSTLAAIDLGNGSASAIGEVAAGFKLRSIAIVLDPAD